MEDTSITLHVESVTANENIVPTTDFVSGAASSTDTTTTSTVLKSELVTANSDDNGLPAFATSSGNAVPSSDHIIDHNTQATVFVHVNRGSSQRPDTILFMVVNTNSNKCVSVFVPFVESRDLKIQGEVSTLAVYVYGLQRQTHPTLEWYRVLSHSFLSIASSISSLQMIDVRMPALRSSDSRKSLPFSAKKSLQAGVEWTDTMYTVTDLHKASGLTFIQLVLDGGISILVHKSSVTSITIPFPLRPATDVQLHHMEITQQSGYVSNSQLPTEKFSFRTKMTQSDVFELYRKAVVYVNANYPIFELLPHLYRNKSEQYFNDIFRKKGGWMSAYIKNDGGDPASVINGRINGLFFSAVLHDRTGLPPPSSPFGSVRLFIPTLWLFKDKMNLYFADFYCHSKEQRHKVTLVLTVKGSEEDAFCQRHLVLLDPYNNPFFFKEVHPSGNGLVRPVVTVRTIVEIFVTMDLNILELRYLNPSGVFIEITEATTSGTSMVNGLPKCPTCNICNLDRFCS